jgi:hypothetical protein
MIIPCYPVTAVAEIVKCGNFQKFPAPPVRGVLPPPYSPAPMYRLLPPTLANKGPQDTPLQLQTQPVSVFNYCTSHNIIYNIQA